MRGESEQEMLASIPSGTFRTERETWHTFVLDATRIQLDWFIKFAVVGARTSTVVVRAPGNASHSVTARRVLDALGEWLLSGDEGEQAFLELPGILDKAC
jgi:hypothetical protein